MIYMKKLHVLEKALIGTISSYTMFSMDSAPKEYEADAIALQTALLWLYKRKDKQKAVFEKHKKHDFCVQKFHYDLILHNVFEMLSDISFGRKREAVMNTLAYMVSITVEKKADHEGDVKVMENPIDIYKISDKVTSIYREWFNLLTGKEFIPKERKYNKLLAIYKTIS